MSIDRKIGLKVKRPIDQKAENNKIEYTFGFKQKRRTVGEIVDFRSRHARFSPLFCRICP